MRSLPSHPLHAAARGDDLVFVELRRGARPLPPEAFEDPLPDWLDLVLCVVAPCLVAAGVLGLYRIGSSLLAGA
ncbi:MAG: hypothetical protein Q8P41_09165 [Pseudomonadota bacterium]|nr:hypothetical protein [Pseudomonadota bacterium]